jgi:hypothetical protein
VFGVWAEENQCVCAWALGLLSALKPHFLFCFFFFALLGFELRASCLLDRCSTTWATPPALGLLKWLNDRGDFCVYEQIILIWVSRTVLPPWRSCQFPPQCCPTLVDFSRKYRKSKIEIRYCLMVSQGRNPKSKEEKLPVPSYPACSGQGKPDFNSSGPCTGFPASGCRHSLQTLDQPLFVSASLH